MFRAPGLALMGGLLIGLALIIILRPTERNDQPRAEARPTNDSVEAARPENEPLRPVVVRPFSEAVTEPENEEAQDQAAGTPPGKKVPYEEPSRVQELTKEELLKEIAAKYRYLSPGERQSVERIAVVIERVPTPSEVDGIVEVGRRKVGQLLKLAAMKADMRTKAGGRLTKEYVDFQNKIASQISADVSSLFKGEDRTRVERWLQGKK